MVARLVTIVTSNGTISVARNTTNSVRLSGNSRNANAYPARIAVTTWPTVMIIVTIALFTQVPAHVAGVPRLAVAAPLRDSSGRTSAGAPRSGSA